MHSNMNQGKQEREACYRPMKDALGAHFANVPQEERFVSFHELAWFELNVTF